MRQSYGGQHDYADLDVGRYRQTGEVKHFTHPADVTELSELILGTRTRPLVVVSTIDAEGRFEYDPEHIERELRGDADVVTVTTGHVTYALEARLPPKAHVFNGAARSYPPSFGENPDFRRSILRFPDRHSVDELINDALAQVTTATVHTPTERPVWTRAIVERVLGAAGNVGRLDDGKRVLINADRLPPGISLAAGLTVGQPVEGWLAGLDFSPEAAEPDLDRFTQDAVTLARIVKVTERRATVQLHPAAPPIILRRRDVIPGADDEDETAVSDVVRAGQIVRARVDRSNGTLALTMVEVDPDAPLTAPLPLLRGGTPWLHEGMDDAAEESQPADDTTTTAGSLLALTPAVGASTLVPLTPAVTRELQDLQQEMTTLRGAFERFSREMRSGTDLETLDQLRDEVSSTRAELNRERERRDELGQMVARLNQELRTARSARPAPEAGGPTSPRARWPDAESWIRHEIICAWVARTTASDKKEHLLRRYEIGAEFISSIEQLDDRLFDKAMRTVVDVVTERAVDIPSRELHQLRTGSGGDDPYVQRADGSWCWRVSVESNTPQARRLHFWRLPAGIVELSRVVLHDDFRP